MASSSLTRSASTGRNDFKQDLHAVSGPPMCGVAIGGAISLDFRVRSMTTSIGCPWFGRASVHRTPERTWLAAAQIFVRPDTSARYRCSTFSTIDHASGEGLNV